jgi:hypothetical protein
MAAIFLIKPAEYAVKGLFPLKWRQGFYFVFYSLKPAIVLIDHIGTDNCGVVCHDETFEVIKLEITGSS